MKTGRTHKITALKGRFLKPGPSITESAVVKTAMAIERRARNSADELIKNPDKLY